MSGMPVSTVADAMLHDAWTNYSQTEATSNLVVYNNTGIRRLFEVWRQDGVVGYKLMCFEVLYKGQFNLGVHGVEDVSLIAARLSSSQR